MQKIYRTKKNLKNYQKSGTKITEKEMQIIDLEHLIKKQQEQIKNLEKLLLLLERKTRHLPDDTLEMTRNEWYAYINRHFYYSD